MKPRIPYRLLFYIGKFISIFGNWVYTTALSLAVAKVHPAYIPWIWIVESVTLMTAGPIMGIASDRLGIQKSILIADLSRMLILAFLPLFFETRGVLAATAAIAMASSMSGAALNPLVTIMGGEGGTYSMNSILGSIQSVSQLFGPIVGGILFVLGPQFAFWFQSGAFLISAFLVGIILCNHLDLPENNRLQSAHPIKMGQERRSRWYATEIKLIRGLPPVLFYLMVTSSIFILGSSIVDALDVLFVTRGIGLKPEMFSVIISVGGMAYLLASFVNLLVSRVLSVNRMVWIGVLLASIGNIVYALSDGVVQLIIGLCILALGTNAFFTTYRVFVQKFTPLFMQGRVSGVLDVFPKGLSLAAVAVSSIFLGVFPVRSIVLAGALITLLAIPFAFLSSAVISSGVGTSNAPSDHQNV